MTWCARLLLCCVLFAGCQATAPPDPAPATVQPEATTETQSNEPAPSDPPAGGGEKGPGGVAFHFFHFTEQVASAAGVVVQGALIGLYLLLFPLIGFGPGGPG